MNRFVRKEIEKEVRQYNNYDLFKKKEKLVLLFNLF